MAPAVSGGSDGPSDPKTRSPGFDWISSSRLSDRSTNGRELSLCFNAGGLGYASAVENLGSGSSQSDGPWERSWVYGFTKGLDTGGAGVIAPAVGLVAAEGQSVVAVTPIRQRLAGVSPGIGAAGNIAGDKQSEGLYCVTTRAEDFLGINAEGPGGGDEQHGLRSTDLVPHTFVSYVGSGAGVDAECRGENSVFGAAEAHLGQIAVPHTLPSHRFLNGDRWIMESGPWPTTSALGLATEVREKDSRASASNIQRLGLDLASLEPADGASDSQEATDDEELQYQLQNAGQATAFRSEVCSNPCRDCGNQAKKDCIHQRCRTCCKSRGFDCSTHVKSTWVPAVKRREKQRAHFPPEQSSPRFKRARSAILESGNNTAATSHNSNSTNTPRSSDFKLTDPPLQGLFPPEVRGPAVCKCVRVTRLGDGKVEYAYHAMVNIGGHFFKGLLYDQGLEKESGSSSMEKQLDGGASRAAMIDLAGIYASASSSLAGGEQF